MKFKSWNLCLKAFFFISLPIKIQMLIENNELFCFCFFFSPVLIIFKNFNDNLASLKEWILFHFHFFIHYTFAFCFFFLLFFCYLKFCPFPFSFNSLLNFNLISFEILHLSLIKIQCKLLSFWSVIISKFYLMIYIFISIYVVKCFY